LDAAPDFSGYGVLIIGINFSGNLTYMECQEVRKQLSAWMDAELDEVAGAALAAHLDSCEACRREWRQLKGLESALGYLSAPVPPGLAEKVLARVKTPRRRQRWQSMALAACLVMGIALGGSMARSFYTPAGFNGKATEVGSLEDFQDFPEGSMGTIVASYQPDEENGSLQ
jgi:predicted anti-sigma-YlaC factor YlaD